MRNAELEQKFAEVSYLKLLNPCYFFLIVKRTSTVSLYLDRNELRWYCVVSVPSL